MADPAFDFRILVAGDVTVDHDVIVTPRRQPHTAEPGEIVYETQRRYTSAGGAGIGARYLSVVNGGHTFLATLTAPTIWSQDLKTILERSSFDDRAPKPPTLLSHWSAEARMPLISRIIEENDDGEPAERRVRWDDPGDLVQLPTYKRKALIESIQRVHQDTDGLQGILINDLDRGSLDVGMVADLANFAANSNIPLVFDPKWYPTKYVSIPAFAMTPNLE